MYNLAGREDCDQYIESELRRARIRRVYGEKCMGEVQASITGKLGKCVFNRAWSYWVVLCKVPLAVAEELYKDPVGKEDIRVSGNCGCPSPKKMATFIDSKGRTLYPMSQKPKAGDSEPLNEFIQKILADKTIAFVEDPSFNAKAFITSYHIDTEVGLRLFADTLKKHGLA